MLAFASTIENVDGDKTGDAHSTFDASGTIAA